MKVRTEILAVLALAAVLVSASACKGPEPEVKDGAGKGPHGGKLLTKDDFGLEVKIFEEGVPPEYRLYGFDDGKPLPPTAFDATITLKRLERTDMIHFSPRGDYLLGDREIVEPHSFDVTVKATRDGRSYEWTYESYEGRTEIKPEELKSAGVVIERVGPARMKNVIELPAQIALNADRTAHVVPRVRGVVTEVRKNLGDRVNRGEIIAVLSSGDLATARQAYLESVQRLELARVTAAREEQLWKKKISPEEDYLISRNALAEAQLARQASAQRLAALGVAAGEVRGQTDLARYVLRSPLTGVVIGKHVTVGEAAEATATLFTVADLSTVWTDISVPQNQLAAIRTGQQVIVHWEDESVRQIGTVTYVEPLVGEETRSARARVVIPNPSGVWRPGLLVKVDVTQNESMVPLAVKAEALQTFRDWDVVFKRRGTVYEIGILEMGVTDGEWVEVLAGLEPGEEYVSGNSFVVKAEIGKSGASHDH